MDAEKLIAALKAKNVNLYRIGDRLKWRAPKGAMPPEDMAKLKQHKAEVLKFVEDREPIEIPKGSRTGNLVRGDCLRVMELMPANSVDLVVTDPPYGYSFMGKDWDKAVPSVEIWKECLRVLKPGGFAYIMSAPRQDVLTRMIANLESAGFNTGFTSLYWTYATGFPKAHNISKAIDKKAGVERTALCRNPNSREACDKSSTISQSGTVGKTAYITEPVTPEAKVLDGSYGGYQPKPAVEVILIVQKPLSEKTYAYQAMVNGKGVTWLDDCRIPYQDEDIWSAEGGVQWSPERKWNEAVNRSGSQAGRFPANLLVSDDVLDDGKSHAGGYFPEVRGDTEHFGLSRLESETIGRINDSGGYSRYFSLDAWVARNLPFLIVPKAPKKEKGFGCENLVAQQVDKTRNDPEAIGYNNPRNRGGKMKNNHHPTVKPIQLMSYLITMGSREGDVVLDPFCGSGTTCLAAFLLKRRSFGIELNPDYFEIASGRYRTLLLESYRNKK